MYERNTFLRHFFFFYKILKFLVTVSFSETFLCESLFSQSTFVNRPALGILPPENFPDKLIESLLSVSVELEETQVKHLLKNLCSYFKTSTKADYSICLCELLLIMLKRFCFVQGLQIIWICPNNEATTTFT